MLPRWLSGKESAWQCRRCKRCRLNPWVWKIPGVGNGNLVQYSFLENSMDRGPWWAIVHRVAKSWTRPSTHTHTSEPGHSNSPPMRFEASEAQGALSVQKAWPPPFFFILLPALAMACGEGGRNHFCWGFWGATFYGGLCPFVEIKPGSFGWEWQTELWPRTQAYLTRYALWRWVVESRTGLSIWRPESWTPLS